jgi:myo-inositol-1(or 4)-monophosphatase
MDIELDAAIGAALTSGRYIAENYGKKLDIESKSNYQDLVTNVDKGSQNVIGSLLKASFPDIGLYGEEDLKEEVGKNRWIIDALDGTTNFIHGVPFFCVSLALEVGGELVIGVIYDPLRDELFYARRGQGTFLNGHRKRVSKTNSLKESLLATGFPYDMYTLDNNLSHFGRFKMITQEVRALGSAALELAYVACGRLDNY